MPVSTKKASGSKAAAKTATHAEKEKKHPTGKLLKSMALSGYQPDFARVILTEPAYTVEEAKTALDKALKGGK